MCRGIHRPQNNIKGVYMKKSIILITLLLCLSLALTGCAAAAGSPAETASGSYAAATTDDVKAALKDGSAVVIDARSQSAYSGWAAGENSLAGHIAGAIDYAKTAKDGEVILIGVSGNGLLDLPAYEILNKE